MIATGQKQSARVKLDLSPQDEALTKKLIESRFGNRGHSNGATAGQNLQFMRSLAHQMSSRMTDARTIFQVLPDMRLISELVIGSVISPGDLTARSIEISNDGSVLPQDIASEMLRIVREYALTGYKIESRRYEILKSILFTHGAFATVIIPENSVDRLINDISSLKTESAFAASGRDIVEQMTCNWGVLSCLASTQTKPGGLTFESMISSPVVYDRSVKFGSESTVFSVVDNYNILKTPYVRNSLRHQQESVFSSIGLQNQRENGSKYKTDDLRRALYRRTNDCNVNAAIAPTADQCDRPPIGAPLIIEGVYDALIPICHPNNPKRAVGYWLLIDPMTGYPLSINRRIDYYAAVKTGYENAQATTKETGLLTLLGQGISGSAIDTVGAIDQMVDNFNAALQADLNNRIVSIAAGAKVDLANQQELSLMMLSRQFANCQTSMLFLPPELVSYIAIDYNETGSGKSLLEEAMTIASMRATALFSQLIGFVRNNAGNENITIKPSPDDANVAETVAMTATELTQARRANFPIGGLNPEEMLSSLTAMGVSISVEGDGINYPNFSVESQSSQGSQRVSDDATIEGLTKLFGQYFGLNPELLGGSVDYSEQIKQTGLMLQRQSMTIQDRVEPGIADLITKLCLNDANVTGSLEELVRSKLSKLGEFKELLAKTSRKSSSSQDDEIVVREALISFFSTLTVRFPKPKTDRYKEDLDSVSDFLDAVDQIFLPLYFDASQFDAEIDGAVIEKLDRLKASYKSHLGRKYIRKHGILADVTPLSHFTSEVDIFDEELESIGDHSTSFLGSLRTFLTAEIGRIKSTSKADEKLAAAMEKATGTAATASPPVDQGGGGEEDVGDFGEPSTEESESEQGESGDEPVTNVPESQEEPDAVDSNEETVPEEPDAQEEPSADKPEATSESEESDDEEDKEDVGNFGE